MYPVCALPSYIGRKYRRTSPVLALFRAGALLLDCCCISTYIRWTGGWWIPLSRQLATLQRTRTAIRYATETLSPCMLASSLAFSPTLLRFYSAEITILVALKLPVLFTLVCYERQLNRIAFLLLLLLLYFWYFLPSQLLPGAIITIK